MDCVVITYISRGHDGRKQCWAKDAISAIGRHCQNYFSWHATIGLHVFCFAWHGSVAVLGSPGILLEHFLGYLEGSVSCSPQTDGWSSTARKCGRQNQPNGFYTSASVAKQFALPGQVLIKSSAYLFKYAHVPDDVLCSITGDRALGCFTSVWDDRGNERRRWASPSVSGTALLMSNIGRQ